MDENTLILKNARHSFCFNIFIHRIILFVCVFVLIFYFQHNKIAFSQITGFSPNQIKDLERVEKYLNSIKSLESRFIQSSKQGIAHGRVLILRPSSLRIEYDLPVPVLMIAKGGTLIYYDKSLQETSYLPVNRTPASFFLKDKIDIFTDFNITNIERGPKSIRITFVQKDNSLGGRVTLAFEDAPMRLVKWQIIDPQGNVVDVMLQQPRFNIKLDKGLFIFSDPTSDTPEFMSR